MNSTTLFTKAPGAKRAWVVGNVQSHRPQGNPLSSGAKGLWKDSVDGVFPETPASRILEVTCGVSPEQLDRLLDRPDHHVDLQYEKTRGSEVFSSLLLALMVAGLLVFALT